MSFSIGDLNEADLSRGFLETLACLTTVDLTPEEGVPIMQARTRAGLRTFVARAGDRVVGTATLVIEPKFIHHGGKIGHLEDVSVHKDFQKQGIGEGLVRHAIDEARRLGCYKVILFCIDRLVPFYGRCGFHVHENGLRLDL